MLEIGGNSTRSCAGLSRRALLRDQLENREALFDPGSDRPHLGSPTIAPDGSRVAWIAERGGDFDVLIAAIAP